MSEQLTFVQVGEIVRDYLPVREMREADRPAYRIQHLGPSALSNIELLQLVGRFRTLETASQLLATAGSLEALARMRANEMAASPEVGPSGAAAIRAAFELGRRLMSNPNNDAVQVRSPEDVVEMLMPQMQDLEQETLVTVLLDTRNRVMTYQTLYVGSLNASMVRVAEVFHEAIRRTAAAIVIVHNHPSGDPSPSPEDIMVTRSIVSAGRLLDIDVLDHVIIGRGRYISLKERGLLNEAT